MAAALSPSRFIIFPDIFFLILLIPLNLSPINRNRGILLLLRLTTPLSQLNLSETLQTSLPPSPLPNINDSADHGASSTNKISTRFREERSPVERIEDGLARARAAIRRAIQTRNYTSGKEETFIPRGVTEILTHFIS